MGSLLLAFLASLIVSAAAIPLVRRLAVRLGAIDRPGHRRLHCESTPRLGGLAVYAGVLVGLTFGLLLLSVETGRPSLPGLGVIGLAATAVVLLGILDDIRSIPAGLKLAVEVSLAVALHESGLRIDRLELPGVGIVSLGETASLAATVLWVAAVTNAFNLIDGVNGLAGGVTGITAVGLMLLGHLLPAPEVVVMGAALAGAVPAFLRHNMRQGGIFLGDSGSLFLGFLFSVAALRLGRAAPHPFFPGAALLLMGLPLVEVGTTVLRRALASRALRRGPAGVLRFVHAELMRPDTGHLHHRLILHGLPAEMTSTVLIVAAAVYCMSAIGLVALPQAGSLACFVAGVVTGICVIVSMFRPRDAVREVRRRMGELGVPSLREMIEEVAMEDDEAEDERIAA